MSDDHQTARTDSFPVLPWNNKDDIDALIERIGTKQIVMLGEASHGTHEYYEWRAEITKRLIAEGGFTFVAVEGDWPDCYAINRYVKGYDTSSKSAKEVLSNFTRWPSWMWANEEVAEFAEWLREHNQDRPKSERVGFYGLDVYSLWDSMQAVVQHLQKVDPQSADKVKEAYRCFDPYGGNETAYAYDTPFVPGKCEDEVIKALELLTDKLQDHSNDGEADFNAQQNARVVRNAEQYYRTMVRGNAASWNVRDRHMHETLQALLDRQVGESKAIIWAHNTHIGDASATDMADA
ncbi:protein-L-isoaspartate O-methyltransferase, partial [Candidatus Saccharibacteria bacterium]